MKLYMLPGNNPRQKKWCEALKNHLGDLFEEIIIHEYIHWETKEKEINFEKELERISILELEDAFIIAKSAGIILYLKLLEQKKANCDCLFAGMPIKWAKDRGINLIGLLKNIKKKAVLVQNKEDPLGSSAEVNKIINENRILLRLIEPEGETHSYDDFGLFREVCGKFK